MLNSTTLCRTCLKENGAFPLTCTTKGYEEIDFAVMLMLCTSVSIEPEDSLPHLICEKCVTTLLVAYTFKQQCERSESFLRSRISLETFKDISTKIKNKKNKSIQENFSGKNRYQNSPENIKIKFAEISENIEIKIEGTSENQELQDGKLKNETITKKLLIVHVKNEDESTVENDVTNVNNIQNRYQNSPENIKIKFEEISENIKIKIEEASENQELQDDKLKNETATKKLLIVHVKNDDESTVENDVTNTDNVQKKVRNEDEITVSYKLDKNEGSLHKNKKLMKYKCTQCDKQFTTRYGLQYHLKQHSGTKNYTCPIEKCKRKFFWEPALKRHMQTHSDEKKYLCYLCGKGYTAADSLRYHIINHKGERPHLCTHCGKTFKQHIHLKYHMSSHNDERTHVCSKCNRSYLGLTQLRKHWKNYCGVGKDPPPKRKSTHFKEV